MSERIVVAIDEDPGHQAVIAWAAERALRTGGRIELLYVIQRSWGEHDHAPGPLLRAAAHALLDSNAEFARRRLETGSGSAPELSTRWAYGHVAQQLELASEDADLLVVGVHRMRDPAREFHGSLGLRVAGTATCAVALVPHDWADDGRGIVVGVDGDLPSETALAFAADEADALHETLTIVCGGFSANPLLAGLVPEISLGDRRQHIVNGAAELARELHPSLPLQERIIEASPPAALITASEGHRLLVVGSRGRHGAKQVLLGSVGHDVLLNLRCPVAVVRERTMSEERTDV